MNSLSRLNPNKIKAVLGLGNPDPEYRNTYHNVGHLIIDSLASSFKKYKHLAYTSLNHLTIAKNLTFMNESALSALELIKLARISPTELLVIHDDSDQHLGRFKLTLGGSSGGHKGIDSIIKTIGTDNFYRLKIGIRTDTLKGLKRQKAEYFVLKQMSAKDRGTILHLGGLVKEKLTLNDTLPPTRDTLDKGSVT